MQVWQALFYPHHLARRGALLLPRLLAGVEGTVRPATYSRRALAACLVKLAATRDPESRRYYELCAEGHRRNIAREEREG